MTIHIEQEWWAKNKYNVPEWLEQVDFDYFSIHSYKLRKEK